MNINRDNYETFFLLYIDNELSVQERNAVNIFVKENPDLQQELEVLEQSILQPEPVVIFNKSKLLKKNSNLIEAEENLLLYIDQELDKNQAYKLETLLKTENTLAAELAILKQTKLFPDNDIVFTNKQSLYRKEEVRVIPFGWWKLAAAAIFIGFGIWATATYFSNNTKSASVEIAANIKIIVPEKNRETTPIITITQKNTALKSTINQQTITEASSTKEPIEKVVNKEHQQVIKKEKPATQEQENIAAKLKKTDVIPSNHLPKPYVDNSVKIKDEPIAIVNGKPQHTQINTNENDHKEGKKSIYTTASFNGNNSDQIEDHFTFSDEEPKKSKLTRLLREAKRKLERNTNIQSGDDNLKVANLSFATH